MSHDTLMSRAYAEDLDISNNFFISLLSSDLNIAIRIAALQAEGTHKIKQLFQQFWRNILRENLSRVLSLPASFFLGGPSP